MSGISHFTAAWFYSTAVRETSCERKRRTADDTFGCRAARRQRAENDPRR